LTAVGFILYYFPYDSNHQEESLNSRLVVWILVGIVVVIGVVLVVTSPKVVRGPKVTIDLVRGEAAKVEVQLDRLAARIAQSRKTVAPGASPNAGLDDAERLLAQAREKLGQARQATDLKQGQQLLVDGREMLRKARRAIELATRPATRPPGM
jgi:hypothetical protein